MIVSYALCERKAEESGAVWTQMQGGMVGFTYLGFVGSCRMLLIYHKEYHLLGV